MPTGDEENLQARPISPTLAAPPILAQPISLPPAQSNWAKIVGGIAMVLGLGGILGGVWGLAAPMITNWAMSLVPSGAVGLDMEYLQRLSWYTVSYSLVSIVLAGLLLAAGVGLVKRRRWAPPVCTSWAILKLILVAVSSVMGYFIGQHTLQFVSQNNPNATVNVTRAAEIGSLFGIILGLMWGWTMPVFLLIWLSRRAIKEEVAEWT